MAWELEHGSAARRIYTELYDAYPTHSGDVGWVRSAISEVTSAFTDEKKIRVREDARYFILINFVGMIVEPLRERVQRDRLIHDLKHDVKLLLDSSSFVGKVKDEVSGHDIVDAIGRNWAQLEVMKLDLWG